MITRKYLLATAILAGSFASSAHAYTVSWGFPIAEGTIGAKVIVSTTGEVVAKYEGNSAAYSNDLYLVTGTGETFVFNNHATAVGTTKSLGTFAAGTELLFKLFVNNTQQSYYTGAPSLNPDGQAHARVEGGYFGGTLVSFEDLFNGPFDFNDLSFSFSNTTAAPPTVPVPAAGILLAGALAATGALRRRKKA